MSEQTQKTELPAVRLRRPERAQVAMIMQSPDDLVPEDHPVRAVWKLVQGIDPAPFLVSAKAREGNGGRDITDPRLLIALWLYATIRGIGSARELARRCVNERPFEWLCGGVTLNHHTLGDFRVDHEAALDDLLTRMVATLVEQDLVSVERISHDGTRVRASAGASSFRREKRLDELLVEAAEQVKAVKALAEDQARASELSARQRAAQERAARERQERIEQAIAQLPELEKRQEKRSKKVSKKDKEKGKIKEPRASTTDPDARVMKMPDGGFRPAVNVQFATDTKSRAIVGVEVINAGVDNGQAEPMRKQVERRSGGVVKEHLVDGGYASCGEIDRAQEQGVAIYMPPKPPRNKEIRGSEFEPRDTDSDAVKEWRERMGSEAGKTIYKERAATSETINADAKAHRGLDRINVRGLPKARCIALWFAIAYNFMHFGEKLIG